jgi:hypothetical protein
MDGKSPKKLFLSTKKNQGLEDENDSIYSRKPVEKIEKNEIFYIY